MDLKTNMDAAAENVMTGPLPLRKTLYIIFLIFMMLQIVIL